MTARRPPRTNIAAATLQLALLYSTCVALQGDPRVAGEHAFATLLCDEATLPAVETLGSSLRLSGHSEPFLVVVPPSISPKVLDRVAAMDNAHAFQAASLPYPFNSTTDRMDIHKPCRFLKLQLWGVTRYAKIVFLDADIIVRRHVGELFDAPGFSAVKDPVGDNFNTGVMVLEPSRYVYSLIARNYGHAGSYNVGDQGALNALVDYASWTALSMRYNTFHTAGATALAAAKVVHYSGDAKPWNFWKARGQGSIPTRAFLEWCRAAEHTPDGACHMRGEVDMRERERVSKRHRYDDTVAQGAGGVSVLLSTYNRESWRELAVAFAGLAEVTDVSVVWMNARRSREARAPHEKVSFVYPQSDSLNNRYLSAGLASDCVYICDDDIFVPAHSFRTGLSVWRQNPGRLVGFYPRLWTGTPAQYLIDISSGYNVVLTKGMFAHRAFLTAYSLFLPRRLARIVDAHMNCEDILFNMMATGMTGLPPLAVMSNETIRDAGKDSGISGVSGSDHLRTRDLCVQLFVREGMQQQGPVSRGSMLPFGKKNDVVGGTG